MALYELGGGEMEQGWNRDDGWLEQYVIEAGPEPHSMSRVAQMAISEVNAPHDMTFAFCKYVASLPQEPAVGIQWDRVSLDSQTLIMTLEHLSLIEGHYWQISGTLKAISSIHTLRSQHDGDSGLVLFECGMPVVAYYDTRRGAGFLGPELSKEATIERQRANQKLVLKKYLDDPLQGMSWIVQTSR